MTSKSSDTLILPFTTKNGQNIFMPSRPRPAGSIQLSGCPYVRSSVDQVKIFVQGRFSILMVASWYFIWGCISTRPAGIYKSHDLMTYISRSTDFGLGQIIKVKIFVQGKMLSSTNDSKLIFRMRMYLYETSTNIQEPWPHDLYFTVC